MSDDYDKVFVNLASMIEGKNEEMSTPKLSDGARIHYIFQSIFVKSLENFFYCNNKIHYIFQSIFVKSLEMFLM